MQPSDCFVVRPGGGLRGQTSVPGDKSISHRSVMLGALADGASHIQGWLAAGDTEATLASVQQLGVPVERLSRHELVIHGGQLHAPAAPLNLVNAGTGIRLMAGMMCGQPFPSVLDGSEQLRRRPMRRIITPLRLMGADISGVDDRAPLMVRPAALHGIEYDMPMASGQVKSAILLAGLFAEGETVVRQPGPARDHTERMLKAFGAPVAMQDNVVRVRGGTLLQPIRLTVPGDVSSAAFLLVAALIVPDSDILLTGVNLNPTRTGILTVLREMGAALDIHETGLEAGEPVGSIRVRHSALRGTTVGGEVVVEMIDEFPILMIAALMAEGETVVRDAQELRVKETDRIAVMAAELRKLGAMIDERPDGFAIRGPQRLIGTEVYGHDDHRVAMSLAVAGLAAEGQTRVLDARCSADSFPGFAETIARLGADIVQQDLPV